MHIINVQKNRFLTNNCTLYKTNSTLPFMFVKHMLTLKKKPYNKMALYLSLSLSFFRMKKMTISLYFHIKCNKFTCVPF